LATRRPGKLRVNLDMRTLHANASSRKVETRANEEPHAIFRRARPWQYGKRGRKYRVMQERCRRLARALSRFDPSGTCTRIFPSVETILRGLQELETRYAEESRMTWSASTVFRTLGRLRATGILTERGLTHMHGTRLRVLHAERLLVCPVESDSPARRQCDRQKVFRKRQKAKRSDKPDARSSAKPAEASAALAVSNLSPPPPKTPANPDEAFLRAWSVLCYQYDPIEAESLVSWVAYRSLAAGSVPRSIRYYTKAVENIYSIEFVGAGYEEAIHDEGANRLLRMCPSAADLLQQIRRSPAYQRAAQECGL
jgi:hypothetical protein